VGKSTKPRLQKSIKYRAHRWGVEYRFNHHILGFIGKGLLDDGAISVNENIRDNFVAITILSIGCEI
jgi:hypothetical protein